MAPSPDRAFLGIHAVNIYVRDQDQSLRFFVDCLGFNLAYDARLRSGERWVAVAPPDGRTVIGLLEARPDSKMYQYIGKPTGVVFLTEDVVATWETWRRRGVRFLFTPRLSRVKYDHKPAAVSPGSGEFPPVWGGIFTRFMDLDGNSFGLAGFDEVNQHIQAERRRIAEKEEKERRAAQELEIAKQVQARLFPQTLPAIETLAYAGACIQAREVGGDYHDFLDLGRRRFGLVIADIAGKGIAAALLMANLQANIRSQCAIALDEPERLLCSVNRLFYENTAESSYATLFFADYCDDTRRLRFANCGHLPPLLLRRGGAVERLEGSSTVVGLFPKWDCSMSETRLDPGDALVLYTDGVTEAFNEHEEEFGERRLVDAVQSRREQDAQSVIGSVVDQLRRFSPHEQHDDITLVVAQCR
ncbi:MAG TPA: SpoIIE family protein phosphatase [Bryobacteraceae bacterium]